MKKILFVSGSSIGYGLDYSMISVIMYLKNKNIDCEVILPREGRTTELLSENNIDYTCIPFYFWKYYNGNKILAFLKKIFKNTVNNILIIKYVKKIKNLENVSLVYSNSFTNNFSYKLAKKLKVPHIQHIREFGEKDFNWKFDIGFKNTVKYASENSEVLICISDAIKKVYQPYCTKNNIIRIYNGVKIPNIKTSTEKTKSNCIKILMIGRLSNEKGQIILLKAINELNNQNIKNIKLDIYGDGPSELTLKEYVIENNLDNIINFKGYCKKINISDYDIGIICSKSEGFGRVTVEYMMNQLAVIGSNSGANSEIILSEKTGLLFENDDYIELAAKIKLLLNNKEKREKFGIEGRKRAIQLFSEKEYNKNIYNICHKIINNKGETK